MVIFYHTDHFPLLRTLLIHRSADRIFILSSAAALVIALATVSYHAIKKARTKPAQSSRYE
jgi:hypothetical protein